MRALDFRTLCTVFLSLTIFSFFSYGGGCTTNTGNTCATALSVPSNCTTGYTVCSTQNFSGVSPTCVGNVDPILDGWFSWTPATTGSYDLDFGGGGGGKDIGVAIYTGSCGNLTSQACSNANSAGDSPETINPFSAVGGTTYYIQIFQTGGTAGITGTFCISQYTATNLNSCSATIYDPGGAGGSTTLSGSAGNYANNSQFVYTYCSNDPSNPYVSLNFSAFTLENGLYDFVTIYDGSGIDNLILGSYTGTENPGIVTSSTGCLTLMFTSDFSVNRLGWQAALTCTNTPGVLPTPTFADCLGAIGLCGTQAVNLSGAGDGTYDDLNTANDGCLVGEHNTVFYYLNIADADNNDLTSGSGTLGFTLTMPNQVDYDYALWGPLSSDDPSVFCSPDDMPTRCSYSVGTGNSNTTMGMDGTTDPDQVSENGGASEDAWVYWLDNVKDGETYLLMIDRWGSDVHDYTLSFSGTAAATGGLDCTIPTPLPVTLLEFNGIHIENRYNQIYWTTLSEQNSDYFVIERSSDGQEFSVIGSKVAAGNSNEMISYTFDDYGYYSPITYYRLKLIDKDGTSKTYRTISVQTKLKIDGLVSEFFPNPASESTTFYYGGKDLSTPINIQIFDTQGKLIESLSISDFNKSKGIEIYTGFLSNGIYNVSIEQGQNHVLKRISVLH